MKRKHVICAFLLSLFLFSGAFAQNKEKIRIAIAGMSHSHVHGLLGNMPEDSMEIVGIAESNRDLAERYAKQYKFDLGLVYDNLDEMLEQTKPQGVLVFSSIFDHLAVVEACAPRGIHVMVEKPMAVSVAHAERMAELAKKHDVMILTNYETTWYPTNHKAYQMVVTENAVGDLRKIIVCDGHKGPKEINVNREFLDWLTDPVLNGGGAVIDFGCYGANLATWLMKNERPVSVAATLQQIKPDVYPNVDDEATIVVTYPKTQVIIQASWNWPINRKDIEIYGTHGYVKAFNATDMAYRLSERDPEKQEKMALERQIWQAPFIYFADAIRGDISVAPTDLSSLENNLIAVEILEAARKSAESGRTIHLENQ